MKRYIAHITIEAVTPLKVGSSKSDFLQDAPIQRDWNNLPMILGTSIAGVLRKDYENSYSDSKVFGFQKEKEDNGEGSKIIFSNALLLDEKREVNEGLLLEKSPFLKYFDNLPIREHTKIDEKGVTGSSKDYSKFDEEVVYKGSQFKFAIEVLEDEEVYENILNLLQNPTFRLGGGSTKGFGKFKILDVAEIRLKNIDDLADYKNSLNYTKVENNRKDTKKTSTTHTIYTLNIEPENFFIFGSGFGDKESDQTPVYEKVIDYEKMGISDKQILIPASSIKGTLSHRTAFYYNRDSGATIENGKGRVGEKNEAIKAIFGHKKEIDKESKKELGERGKVLFSDCYKSFDEQKDTKVFDHVSIDRFTGGAIDGALFQERTVAKKDIYEIEILLEKSIEAKYIKAFEKALDDIRIGMLPLGGATTKGHGVFVGEVLKDMEVYHVER